MLRILHFLFSTIYNKNSFILFFILCFSQFSGQIFFKNETTSTVESGIFLQSDTIVSELKPSIGASPAVQGNEKIYVAQGAVIIDLNNQLKSNIVYIKNGSKRHTTRLKPRKKVKKTELSIITPIKNMETLVKKKPVFYKSSNSEEFYSKIGKKFLAILGGSNFSVKKNMPAQGIAYRNTLVFFDTKGNRNIFLFKNHFVAVNAQNTVKMRGPPRF